MDNQHLRNVINCFKGNSHNFTPDQMTRHVDKYRCAGRKELEEELNSRSLSAP